MTDYLLVICYFIVIKSQVVVRLIAHSWMQFIWWGGDKGNQMMKIFGWLIIGHLIGDYLLQNQWMAEKKSDEWVPLFIHSTVYTLTVYLMSLIGGGLSWRGIILIYITHLILDRRFLTDFWIKYITFSNSTWLATMVDQSWHIIVLGFATLI